MVPIGSGPIHGRPTPGTAGEEQLGFGGAALTISAAAEIRVCLRFGILRARIGWIAALVLLASGALAAAHENPGRTSSRSRLTSTSDSESSSKVTSRPFAKTDYDQEQASRQQAVIDRIIFLGNRRIR